MLRKSVRHMQCLLCVLLTLLVATPSAFARELGLKPGQKVFLQDNHGTWTKTPSYYAGRRDSVVYLTTDRGEVRIDWAVTKDGKSVSFSLEGAKYDPRADSLYGTGFDGKGIAFPLSDIRTVRVTFVGTGKPASANFDQETTRRRLNGESKYPVVQAVPLDSIRCFRTRYKPTVEPIIGCLAGGAIGLYFGLNEPEDGMETLAFAPLFGGLNPRLVGDVAAGMVVGSVIGYVIGLRSHTIRIDRLKVAVAPNTQNGSGLSLAFNF